MTDNAGILLEDPPNLEEIDWNVAPTRLTVAAPEPEPLWIRRGHIPGLDGLRAIAVLMVLLTHAHQTAGFPDWPAVKSICHHGAAGVDVFFVISGFLITTLLVRELERKDQIQLKRFYLRRFLRIMPAYVALMAAVAVGQCLGNFRLQSRDWIGAATYTTNFLYHPSWELGHGWSLSIEEHFYLLWPFVLYAGGVAWGWRIGLVWLAVCWLIRCGIAFGLSKLIFPPESIWSDTRWCSMMAETWTFTRLDTITMGSLLALASRTVNGRACLNRVTGPGMLWVYFIMFCISLSLSSSSKYNLCVAYSLNAICIALLIWGLVQSRGVARCILNSAILKAIGLGSYSIYLWQQLFVNPHGDGWIQMFPQNLVLALGAAALSYWLIERPMNQLKDRVAG